MSRPLTPEQNKKRTAIIIASRAAGDNWDTIATRVGMQVKSLERWWRIVRCMPVGKREPKPGTTMRQCLGPDCSARFPSEGAHNRLCDRCRSRSASPYTPSPGGSTGRQTVARKSIA